MVTRNDEHRNGKAPLVDLSEQEQRNIINQTGILKQIKQTEQEEEPHALIAAMLVIPLLCCHTLFDYLIYVQFGITNDYGINRFIETNVPMIPAIFMLAYVTNLFKPYRAAQMMFMIGAVIAGYYLIHLTVDVGTWGALSRVPGFVTIGILLVIQMDILYAFLSVLCCVVYYNRQFVSEYIPTGSLTKLDSEL